MGRALLGWIVLCAGIGLAISTARFAAGLTSAPAAAVPLLQALLVTALVVPVILLLRSKVDRKSAADLGLSRRMLTPVIFGLTVGVASGAATWLPALWMGWISIERVDYGTLMSFLVINAFVLLLYEALPEELALRGYAWANLRSRWSPLIATWIVTVLFIFSSSLISIFQFGSARLLDVEPVGLGWAPAGTDPVAYVLQLGLFGLVLCAARRAGLARLGNRRRVHGPGRDCAGTGAYMFGRVHVHPHPEVASAPRYGNGGERSHAPCRIIAAA
ncbi:type II CAAX prenyl endopeptidase Rce1 family protein [Arthrobacter sunyaminii]|uniref:CPBP family intramembrane metalloprotease n=1 Tax=Arthrobacter sunyaminii TaxID=2816859 RepID=A0A975S5G9_9MICC|nr:CPBP family glutamic-type intramembrane protease [Arthrobacter sunyaminii]MBO0908691.1 CPBP family intramembrane metalloprotease [Arthrobacter sunyaminii]QWQ35786.1 CPBP family intramembrane metalloprotease [Arthrobacter sunyaminii]